MEQRKTKPKKQSKKPQTRVPTREEILNLLKLKKKPPRKFGSTFDIIMFSIIGVGCLGLIAVFVGGWFSHRRGGRQGVGRPATAFVRRR